MCKVIKSVDVRMSRLGLNVPGQKRKVVYLPIVTINNEDAQKESVQADTGKLFGRFKKSDYQGKAISKDFFVLVFKSEWEFFSSEGELIVSIPPCGQIVGVDEHCVVVRNGDEIAGYDKEGKNVGSRQLTTEEIEMLNEVGN